MAARRASTAQRKPAEWDFYSFPVAWAFACGGLLATLVTAFIGPQIPFVVMLFGASFGLSHVVFHTLRKRTVDKEMERKEEEEMERRILAQRANADETGTSSRRARRRRRV